MRKAFLAVAVALFVVSALAQEKQATSAAELPIQGQVRRLWQAYKNKDKATLSSLIDNNFRMFEEGLAGFSDKKGEVNSVDEFELTSYTLSDFSVKPLGPNTALVTYIAQYEGKSGGETSKAKSVFGEVWIRSSGGWKALYLQETYMK